MNAAAPQRELVRAEQVSTSYRLGSHPWARRSFRAVDRVDLSIGEGEVLALVGESGSGKTTLGRTLLRLIEPAEGEIFFDGRPITHAGSREMRALRRDMQIIFQDPYASLDPRMSVGEIVGEGLAIHGVGRGADRASRVDGLLELVGLQPEHASRYPHALSGGQRQRVGIARALALNPRFVVADEPVSSLDVSVQAQIINVLSDLRRRLGITLLFISHNLGVVRTLADRVAVMYHGKLVEVATTGALFERPAHPYTRALLASVPVPDPAARRNAELIGSEPPRNVERPFGCVFRARCPFAVAECAAGMPALRELERGHAAACLRTDVGRRANAGDAGDRKAFDG